MMLKSLENLKVFLSADDHLQIALYLINQPKSILWLKGWLPPEYDHKNIYSLLTRLKNRQLVSQTGNGQFLLSAIGRNRLLKLYPLLAGRPLDMGYFYTAILDFGGYINILKVRPSIGGYGNVFSKRRLELMKLLWRWGWGRLARGIYLTGSQFAAKTLRERLLELRLSEEVIQGKLAVDENQKNRVDRVFNLTARNSDWRLIIDRINEWERIGEPEKGLRLIRKDFLMLMVTEPPLPNDLLPEPYWREEIITRMRSLI
ncbi:hypothetical protein HZB78_03775 [Candidatus Collierbacteria bacterium]|nr:hypothetical protein [Candidatus Collierbacteria bacterium]